MPWPNHLLGNVYLWNKQPARAVVQAERTVALAPNFEFAYASQARILSFSGRADEAPKVMKQAMRLNPRYPAHYLFTLGVAYEMAGQYADAIAAYRRALTRRPTLLLAHLHLAFSYSELGRAAEARAAAAEVLRIHPAFSVEAWVQRMPFKEPSDVARYMTVLRQTGLK